MFAIIRKPRLLVISIIMVVAVTCLLALRIVHHQESADGPTYTLTLIRRMPTTDLVQSVAFSPDDTQLAMGLNTNKNINKSSIRRNKLLLWNIRDVSPIRMILLPQNPVYDLKYSPDGEFIACGCSRAKAWNISTGKEFLTSEHSGGKWGIAFSPDSSMFACQTPDQIEIWDMCSASLLRKIETMTNTPTLYFSHSGDKLLFSAGGRSTQATRLQNNDDHLEVLDLRTGSRRVYPQRYQGGILRSPGGDMILSNTQTGTKFRDLASGHYLYTIEWRTSKTFEECEAYFCLSPDNGLLIVIMTAITTPESSGKPRWASWLSLYDGRTGRSFSNSPFSGGIARSAVFSHNGKYLAIGDDKGVTLWKVQKHDPKTVVLID